jgi:hypothetical protein
MAENPKGSPSDRDYPSRIDQVFDRQPRDGYLGDARDGQFGGRTS